MRQNPGSPIIVADVWRLFSTIYFIGRRFLRFQPNECADLPPTFSQAFDMSQTHAPSEPDSPAQRALNARLLAAVHKVDAPAAGMALDDGANPSTIDRATGCSALFWAAGYGMAGVMRRLITEGADINSRSLTGRTPLFAAATNESDAAARVLLEAGAPDSLEDDEGKTALLAAAQAGSLAGCQLLLHTEKNRGRKAKTTPLIEAADRGGPALIRLLMTVCDPLAVDRLGRTAFLRAAQSGNVQALFLLAPVSDMRRAAKGGATPWDAGVNRARSSNEDYASVDALATLGIEPELAEAFWKENPMRMPRFSALREQKELLAVARLASEASHSQDAVGSRGQMTPERSPESATKSALSKRL